MYTYAIEMEDAGRRQGYRQPYMAGDRRNDLLLEEVLSVFDEMMEKLPGLAARLLARASGIGETEPAMFHITQPSALPVSFGLGKDARSEYVMEVRWDAGAENFLEYRYQLVMEGTATGQIVLSLYGIRRSDGEEKRRGRFVTRTGGTITVRTTFFLAQRVELGGKVRLRCHAGEEIASLDMVPVALCAYSAEELCDDGLAFLLPFLPLNALDDLQTDLSAGPHRHRRQEYIMPREARFPEEKFAEEEWKGKEEEVDILRDCYDRISLAVSRYGHTMG